MWPLPALVVHRTDAVPLPLDDVDLRAEPEFLRSEEYRALVNVGWRTVCLPLAHPASLSGPVHCAVIEPPLDGVRAIGELSLHPFEVAEPRAIGELVEHADAEEGRGRRRILRSLPVDILG